MVINTNIIQKYINDDVALSNYIYKNLIFAPNQTLSLFLSIFLSLYIYI